MRHLSHLLLATLLLTSSVSSAQPNSELTGPSETQIVEAEPLPYIEAEPLPNTVIDRIKTNLSQRLSLATYETITTDDITIARYSRETWSDGCLGLGGPAESCLAALTEGWQVEATYEDQQFFYRTDLSGNHIRHSTLDNNLPPSLQTRILQTAQAEELGKNLSIVEAQPKLWGGCYGLPSETEVCTAIGIYGWQAIVTDGDHYWIYHTDNLGNTILLNEVASSNTAIPTFMNASEIEGLDNATTFQSTIGEGMIRDIFTLNNDGQISAYSHTTQTRRSGNINQQQLDNFYNQLTENNFNSFNGLLYLPKLNAENYRIVTLTSQVSHAAFADFIYSDLPPQLQKIAQGVEALQVQTTPVLPTTVANSPQSELPEDIQSQIRFNLAIRLRIPIDRISIQNYSRQTWSDGCLGLGGPTELCLAALTEGWQVEAVDTETNETYVYRTNLKGDQIRRAP